jgi:hypothetical protein
VPPPPWPGLYVPRDLVPIYRDIILPLADVCVPNQFEAELLTGRRIRSLADAFMVMELMHERGVGTVILSSTQLESASATLVALASQRLSPSLTSMASPLPTPAAAADSAAEKPPAEVDILPFREILFPVKKLEMTEISRNVVNSC